MSSRSKNYQIKDLKMNQKADLLEISSIQNLMLDSPTYALLFAFLSKVIYQYCGTNTRKTFGPTSRVCVTK